MTENSEEKLGLEDGATEGELMAKVEPILEKIMKIIEKTSFPYAEAKIPLAKLQGSCRKLGLSVEEVLTFFPEIGIETDIRNDQTPPQVTFRCLDPENYISMETLKERLNSQDFFDSEQMAQMAQELKNLKTPY